MSSEGNNGNVKFSIYRQYIHDIQTPFVDNINKLEHIDFILSFASEEYDVHGKGTGYFHPTWNVEELNIEWVKKVKEISPHVRVIISIGGVGSEFPFNPSEKRIWIYNAIHSIKRIIRDLYENLIDGIDIHYDVIESNEDEFSFCIGEVIRKLKNDLSINVASIAPNERFQSYYLNLYLQNQDIIDLVDYQFYNLKPRTLKQLVELYQKLVDEYTPAIVLPIISSHSVPIRIIIEFIIYLIQKKLLPGIVVWDDNNSTVGSTNSFSLENVLQHL